MATDERATAILLNLNLRDQRDGYKAAAELLRAEVERLTARVASSEAERERLSEAVTQAHAAWWAWKRASLFDAGFDGHLWKNVNLTQMALDEALRSAGAGDGAGVEG